MGHILRAIPILLLGLILAGCAAHQTTKNDNTASAGFTGVKDGWEQVDQAFFDIEKEPLSATQKAAVGNGRTGSKKIKDSAGVAAKAYSDTSAENEKLKKPGADRQADRLNLGILVGAVVFALGCGLIFGGASYGLKGVGIILAVTGGILSVWLMLLGVITPALEMVAMGIGIIAVLAFGWFVIEKFRERKKLAAEQTATKEIAEKLPEGQVAAIASDVSDATAALLTQAKNLSQSQQAAALT